MYDSRFRLLALCLLGTFSLACGGPAQDPCVTDPSSCNPAGVTSYHIDFEDALSTVNGPPIPLNDGKHISQLLHGDPKIVNNISAMVGNALQFNTFSGSTYDQVSMDVRFNKNSYQITFDFYGATTVTNDNTFSVVLGFPTIQKLVFSIGKIRVDQPHTGIDGEITTKAIGNYADGVRYLVELNVDMTGKTWEIFVDNVSLYQGAITADADDLKNVRFVSGAFGANKAGSFVIDTIDIRETP